MLIQILQRTPPWVFALFLALVAFGVPQTRTRQVTRLLRRPRRVAFLARALRILSAKTLQ